MALFNFNKRSSNDDAANAGAGNAGADKNIERLPVVLQLNEDAITISAEDAEGLTVGELFEKHGADLGDINRINRFVAAGQLVNRSASVVLGTVYRGAVTSEDKGFN
jgi:hypothetical protein